MLAVAPPYEPSEAEVEVTEQAFHTEGAEFLRPCPIVAEKKSLTVTLDLSRPIRAALIAADRKRRGD
jgi:hypothetical protein